MSNQGYYNNGPPAGGQQPLQSNNPYSQPGQQQQNYHQQQQPQQQQQQQPTYGGQPGGYAPPPGLPPRRGDTFQESDFVPESERGEQRETMEQFEMSRSKPETSEERDMATLQREFPKVDGSLIAAIYGDSQSLGATREVLQELAASN